MGNCPESPFVKNAKEFLKDRNCDGPMKLTVKFFLENDFCGIENRTKMSNVLKYLEKKGYSLSREQFQQKILVELKRKGIITSLVYPGSKGGLFIPCNLKEVNKATEQVFDRICSHLKNIEYFYGGEDLEKELKELKKMVEKLKNELNVG